MTARAFLGTKHATRRKMNHFIVTNRDVFRIFEIAENLGKFVKTKQALQAPASLLFGQSHLPAVVAHKRELGRILFGVMVETIASFFRRPKDISFSKVDQFVRGKAAIIAGSTVTKQSIFRRRSALVQNVAFSELSTRHRIKSIVNQCSPFGLGMLRWRLH